MSTCRTFAAAVIALLALSTTAFATPMQQGTTELQGAASLTNTSIEGTSVTVTSLNAFYGYCIGGRWEIGPGLGVSAVAGNGTTISTLSITGDVLYNFVSSGNTVPFLLGAVGFSNASAGGNSETTTIIPRLGGGIRILMGNSASLNFGAFYQHSSNQDLSANAVEITAGFSIFPNGSGR